jgi:GNAT superfamily N-acetyltransferase
VREAIDGGYELDDDRERVDRDALWAFLSTEAYWARWRDRSVVEAQLGAAWRVLGAYDRAGAMVGFARAVSDGITVAYLADVFIVPAARGSGLGVALVRAMVDEGPGAHLRWMLHTRDAHGLYRRFGFGPPSERVMERPR